MSNRNLFRMAIIGTFIFELSIAVALYIFDDGSLDPAWEMLPETVDWSILFEFHFSALVLLGIVILFLLVVPFVGVLLFRNWGRWLYLISMTLYFPVYILSGPTIYYAWESALWDIACMAQGAILIVMFLPPIKNEFNNLSQQDAASGAAA